eukprot:759946-Hanusia_phi.AAC.3
MQESEDRDPSSVAAVRRGGGWRVPPGIFLFADERTLQHVAPNATRPLVSVLLQPLSSLQDLYVEVRLVNQPDRGRGDLKPSIGFALPKIADTRCVDGGAEEALTVCDQRNPGVDDLIVRVESDELVIRHKTSMLRKNLVSFGAGDTVGMGIEPDTQSVFVVKNGRRIKTEKVSPALVADLMSSFPVLVLCSDGCLATFDLNKRPPSSENRTAKSAESLLTHNLCNSLMVFDDKQFKRLKFGNHLAAKKVGAARLDTVHVRKALSDMKMDAFPFNDGVQYFEVTFSCLYFNKENVRERNGVQSMDGRLERSRATNVLDFHDSTAKSGIGLFLCDARLAKTASQAQRDKMLIVCDNGDATYGGQRLSLVVGDEVRTKDFNRLFGDGDIVGCGFIQKKGIVLLFVNGKPLGHFDKVHVDKNGVALPLAAASREEQVV